MDAKTKWYVETGLDIVCTWALGWMLFGAMAASLVTISPDAGEIEKFLPVIVRIAVTFGFWKLFRSFNWLRGVPPERIA